MSNTANRASKIYKNTNFCSTVQCAGRGSSGNFQKYNLFPTVQGEGEYGKFLDLTVCQFKFLNTERRDGLQMT